MTDHTLAELTTELIAAYIRHNAIPAGALPSLIASVHATLAGLGRTPAAEPVPALVPAIPIKKSVTDDYIVCLEDGKRFKSLKRHLAQLGMTPQQYRAKWALDPEYPMVAPGYSARRSDLAKEIGLGRKRVEMAEAA